MPQPATQPPARQVQPATAARFFDAPGDPARLRLLAFLLDGEHTAGECVAHVGLSQGRVSVHLACLAGRGYLACRRAGRYACYRVADPRVADLITLARAGRRHRHRPPHLPADRPSTRPHGATPP